MWTRSRILAFAVLFAPVAAQASPTQAGDPDPRWRAFLGCWEPDVQNNAEAVQQHVVCFREHESGAVAVTTVVDDEVRSEKILRADGSAHPVREGACVGTETASWSADGARVYVRSVQRCGESALGRETADVLVLSGAHAFIEVQAVGVDDQYGVRVLHYRLLEPAAYPAFMRDLADAADDASRLYAAAPLSLDDILEAGDLLPTAAVRAMLVNLPETRIRVDAGTLLALADAGVKEALIDILVALAHPEKFAMAIVPPVGEERAHPRREGLTALDYDPWMCDGRHGYNGYLCSAFGSSRYGWGYGGGTIVIVDGNDDDATPGSRGAVVKERGYTRVGESPDSGTTRAEPRSASSSRRSVDRSGGTRSTTTTSPSRGSNRESTRQAEPRSPSGGGN